jgi:hypothetical protein
MDILTRIKNSEFRGEVLKKLQSAKINDQIEGAELVTELPVTSLNDVYYSIICKIVQDINKHNPTISNTIILHDVILLSLCKSRKGKKFDTYYDEIISDIEKNISLVNKIFID